MHRKFSFIFDLHIGADEGGPEAQSYHLFSPSSFAGTLPNSSPKRPGSIVGGAQWCLDEPPGPDITIPAFSGFHFLFLSARLLKYILQPLVALFPKLP